MAASWRNADTDENFQGLEVKEGELHTPSSAEDAQASVELFIINRRESKPIQEGWARKGGDIELRVQLEDGEEAYTLRGKPQFRLVTSTTTRLGMNLETKDLPVYRQ